VRKCGAAAFEGEAQRDATQAAERAQFVEKAAREFSITKRSPSTGVLMFYEWNCVAWNGEE
jgi:hypothetical protein